MYKKVVTDRYKRILFVKVEYLRIFQKYIENCSMNVIFKYINNLKFSKKIQGLNFIYKNRCVVSWRGRAVLRFCKLSRIKFKELSNTGVLSGVSKSTW